MNAGTLACVFGRVLVATKFISSTMLNCTAPPSPTGGAVGVNLPNSKPFNADLTFRFDRPTTLLSLIPPLGPAAGSTRVSVVATGFTAGTQCHFGPLSSPFSAFVSENEIVCVAPPGAGGSEVVLYVTNNGRE